MTDHKTPVDELAEARAEVEHYAERCREYRTRAENAESERDAWQATARGWKAEAEKAGTARETWDENHQILSEHYQRMTERAERAEAEVEVKDQRIADVRDYWKNDRERLQAEKAKADVTREEATRLMIHMTSRARRAENRAAALWEVAKALCRERIGDTRCDPARMRHLQQRVEDAETARDAADAEVLQVWRRNRLALSVLNGTSTESEANHATD